MVLLLAFGVLALALAVTGSVGVVSYAVSARAGDLAVTGGRSRSRPGPGHFW
jgi:hypothetical protein